MRASICSLMGATAVVVASVSAAHAEETAGSGGMTVSVVKAVSHCFPNRVSASGVIVAKHEVELRPGKDQEGMVLTDLLVERGDTVLKGEVLARLLPLLGAQQDPGAVKTPVNGILLGSTATVGSLVSAEKQPDPLFRIAMDGELEVKAEILASGLQRVRAGMSAKVHVVGLGDLDGRLVAVGDGVDAITQLGTLRISIPTEPHLRVGMFARVDVDGGENCGLSIPLSALLYGPDGSIVGVVRDDRVAMRSVATGLLEDGNVEIRDGLQENDLVVARAGTFLREGDRVHPIEASAEAK